MVCDHVYCGTVVLYDCMPVRAYGTSAIQSYSTTVPQYHMTQSCDMYAVAYMMYHIVIHVGPRPTRDRVAKKPG